jgi:flagellar FliL protein
MDEEKVEETSEQPKPKKNKLFLLAIVAVVLLLAAGSGYFFFLKKGEKPSTEPSHTEAATKSVLVPLDPFILNLMEQGRFLKVTMQLELTAEEYKDMVDSKIPQIRDAIITLVSSKSVESISSPEGKMQLKDEILLRANQAVGRDVFKSVYFTEFVMQ